jgi:outer membrane protein
MTRAGLYPLVVLALVMSLGTAKATSLDHAGRLLVANDPAGARAAVQAAAITTPDEEAVALWIVALSHMRQAEPRAALPHLERLVTLAPDVPRFRLELARALFLAEQDDRARFHFESALAGQLSLSEIEAVNQYLDQIEKRKSWQGHVSLALVPQSNPRRASGETQVLVGNVLPVPLAQARRDMGLDVGLGVTWLPKLGGDWRARPHLMTHANRYRDFRLNRLHVLAEVGVLHLGDLNHQIGAGVSAQAAFGDTGRVMEGVGVYATFQRRLGERTLLRLRASADRLNYPDVPQMDGWRAAMSADVQHVLSPQLRLDGSINLSQHNARADFNRRQDVRVQVGARYAYAGGLTAGVSASVAQTRFAAANPLLPQFGPAQDRHFGVTTSFLHRELIVKGFAPVLEIGAERQTSTVPMRAFTNLRASIGATRNF